MIRITIAMAAIAAVCGTAGAAENPALGELAKLAGGDSVKVEIPAAGAEKAAEAPAEGPAAKDGKARAESVYTDDRGCEAVVEETPNGYMLYVRKGTEQAVLGILKDFSGGDIAAFCAPADASFDGRTLSLSCGEQHNGGYATRGRAEIDLAGGLSAVRIRGEVKRTFGWKTETDLVCEGLKPARGFAF